MQDEDQTEHEQPREGAVKRLATKVLLGLGVLQVYNIVSHRQAIIDLSQSVELLAAWWRYLTGLPFQWLHLPFTQLQREMLVLLLFFFGAANLAWKRDHRHSLLTAHWRSLRGGIDPDVHVTNMIQREWQKGRLTRPVVAFILWLALLSAMLGAFMFDGVLALIYNDKPWQFVVSLVLIPAGFFVIALTTIASCYKMIMRSLRWLLVLLIADLVARYAIDPVIAGFPQIPMPPHS